jgi:hypothetical protein
MPLDAKHGNAGGLAQDIRYHLPPFHVIGERAFFSGQYGFSGFLQIYSQFLYSQTIDKLLCFPSVTGHNDIPAFFIDRIAGALHAFIIFNRVILRHFVDFHE